MMQMNSSLRTNHSGCHLRRRPFPSTAWASGNFASPSLHFGSPQLPNDSLRTAHCWVSRSVALRLQYAPGNGSVCGAHCPAGKPNFSQGIEQRSRAKYAGEAAPGWSQRWANYLQWRPHNGSSDKFFNSDCLFLCFWASLLTVVKLATFYFKKQDFPLHPNSLAKSVMAKTAWRSIANSWCLTATIATAASAGDFLHMWHRYGLPPPLQATTPPFDHVGSSRRPEKEHWTELLYICSPPAEAFILTR